MNNQFPNYQPTKPISAKRQWFAYFAIILFFNIFVLLSEKYPILLKYIAGGNGSKRYIASDGSFEGFVELEKGTYNIIFYLLMTISIVILFCVLKINAQTKSDKMKDKDGSVRLQLTYLIGALGLLLFLIHGEWEKFLLFSALAVIGIFKVFPGREK